MHTSRRFKVLKLDVAGFDDSTADRLSELLQNIGSSICSLEIDHQRDPTPLKLSNLAKMFLAMKNLKSILIKSQYRLDIDTMPVLNLSHVAEGVIEIVKQLKYLPELDITSDGDGCGWTLRHIKFDEILGVDTSVFHSMRILELSSDGPFIPVDEMRNNFMSEILANQNFIENLSCDFSCGSNLLRNICNKTSLNKLELCTTEIVPDEICALGKLNQLEQLWLEVNDEKSFEEFLGVAFPNLKCLEIIGPWPSDLDDRTLRGMMTVNWPKLEKLEGSNNL